MVIFNSGRNRSIDKIIVLRWTIERIFESMGFGRQTINISTRLTEADEWTDRRMKQTDDSLTIFREDYIQLTVWVKVNSKLGLRANSRMVLRSVVRVSARLKIG